MANQSNSLQRAPSTAEPSPFVQQLLVAIVAGLVVGLVLEQRRR